MFLVFVWFFFNKNKYIRFHDISCIIFVICVGQWSNNDTGSFTDHCWKGNTCLKQMKPTDIDQSGWLHTNLTFPVDYYNAILCLIGYHRVFFFKQVQHSKEGIKHIITYWFWLIWVTGRESGYSNVVHPFLSWNREHD